jgi:uncharacterized protein involved in outer membrane biogenesis
LTSIHVTDIESAINYWREREPSSDGIVLPARVRALALNCAVADIAVTAGVLRPRLLVLDTLDSTVWVDGTLSLATEKLDLRLVVAPKDFSVLTLRSPLHVTGTFAKPGVQVEKGPLVLRLGAAVLLGLVNPLAAFMPLVDTGDSRGARVSAERCRQHK